MREAAQGAGESFHDGVVQKINEMQVQLDGLISKIKSAVSTGDWSSAGNEIGPKIIDGINAFTGIDLSGFVSQDR